MPSAMEKVIGIAIMVTAAGTYSVGSSKAMSFVAGHHQAADENQRRGGGEGGDRSGEWSEVQRRQEQHRHGDGNEPGAPAGVHSGGALDVARCRRGAESRAGHGRRRIYGQRSFETWQRSIRLHASQGMHHKD